MGYNFRRQGDVERAMARFENRYVGIPLPSPAVYSGLYCDECDDIMLPVFPEGSSLQCPMCGMPPSALELGRSIAEEIGGAELADDW